MKLRYDNAQGFESLFLVMTIRGPRGCRGGWPGEIENRTPGLVIKGLQELLALVTGRERGRGGRWSLKWWKNTGCLEFRRTIPKKGHQFSKSPIATSAGPLNLFSCPALIMTSTSHLQNWRFHYQYIIFKFTWNPKHLKDIWWALAAVVETAFVIYAFVVSI